MELKNLSTSKLAPWNWFRHEDEGRDLDVQRSVDTSGYTHPLLRMHREMDRLFEEIFGSGAFPGLSGHGNSNGSELLLRPKVDIMEDEEQYRISVEVPGIREKDLQISLDKDRMIISGEKRSEHEDREEGRLHRVERSYGHFQRVLSLPQDALGDDAKARFDNGILTITVPRDASQKDSRRVIEIEADNQ